MSIPEAFITDWPDGPYWNHVQVDDPDAQDDLDLVLLKRDTLDALIQELREARHED